MKLTMVLIRAGMTRSGREGRQLGTVDEPLLDQERERLRERAGGGIYPEADLTYVSALYRCRETATLIYPRVPAVVLGNLRALDAGVFEGMTRDEILKDEAFSQWAEPTQLAACPQGEDPYRFRARCAQAFRLVVDEMCSKGFECTAIITHNLVIGTILQRICIPRSAYRNWDIQWGGGYVVEYDSIHSTAKLQAVL